MVFVLVNAVHSGTRTFIQEAFPHQVHAPLSIEGTVRTLRVQYARASLMGARLPSALTGPPLYPPTLSSHFFPSPLLPYLYLLSFSCHKGAFTAEVEPYLLTHSKTNSLYDGSRIS